ALYEAGAALRVFVLRSGAFRFARLAIVKIISRTRAFADGVLMIQPYVEPNRRIEGAVLVQAQPGKLVIKSFGGLGICEVIIRDSTISERAGDPVNELPHRSFSSAFVRVGPVGNVAVEILRHGDFRSERA